MAGCDVAHVHVRLAVDAIRVRAVERAIGQECDAGAVARDHGAEHVGRGCAGGAVAAAHQRQRPGLHVLHVGLLVPARVALERHEAPVGADRGLSANEPARAASRRLRR